MASKYTNLALTWFDQTDGYVTSDDITTDLIGSGLFTDTGSGEVNEFEFSLSAKGGKYLNTGNILQERDRFCITLDDLDGNTYGPRYFELIDVVPVMTKPEGATVLVKCLGIEYHTQLVHYAKRSWFDNAFRVAKNIGEVFQDNRGSQQPVIDRHDESYSTANKYGNGLPLYTSNHYEFGLVEDNCYNRWMDMIDLLGGAVTSGGVLDFFELGFDTFAVNGIDTAIFSSGGRSRLATDDANHVTIKNGTSINVSEQEGGISNSTGTKVMAWGSQMHGTLPTGLAKYRGHELEFVFRPTWVSGIEYIVGAKTLYLGKHWECATAHNSADEGPPPNAFWTQIDMGDEFGDTIQYSEWTDDKTALWMNAGSNPTAVTAISSPTHDWATSTGYDVGNLVIESAVQYVALTKHTSGTFATDLANGDWEIIENGHLGIGAGFFDSNLVVRDDKALRIPVNEAVGDLDYDGSTDTGGSGNYVHTNGTHSLGHRYLNVNTNTFLSGTDKNGTNYADAVVEWREQKGAYTGTAGEWVIIYTPDSTTDRMQVAVRDTGTLWEWDDSASRWKNITSVTESGIVFRNDDCFHQYAAIYNVQGVDPRPHETDSTKYPEITKAGGTFAKNTRSAIEVVYTWGETAGKQHPLGASDYRKGAWLNFSIPFPLSTYNSITEGVGDIYGGGLNEANPMQPSYLDIENMSYDSQGLLGFNNASSEELGSIQTMGFHTRIGIYDTLGNPLDGTATIRTTFRDGKDNVVIQDFEVKFTNGRTWQEAPLQITGFTTYRGREPKSYALRGLTIAGFEIPLKELDIQDVFEFQNIKDISFQIQNFYDDDGRYNPEKDMFALSNTGLQTSLGGVIKFAMDTFHFKKPLLVSTGVQTVTNIEPVFLQRPSIISYVQLLNDAKSHLEIEKFKHKEFNFQSSGRSLFDIRFGDTFFLENDKLIVDTDDTTVGETAKKKIKLVAKRIEYHLTKPRVGPGGITRSIKGVKRFT